MSFEQRLEGEDARGEDMNVLRENILGRERASVSPWGGGMLDIFKEHWGDNCC